MSRFGRGAAALGGSATVLLLGVLTPVYADGSFQHCLNQAVDHNGEPPTCTRVNGNWEPSWPGDSASGAGFPAAFGFLFVVVLLVGIAVTVWKVTTAQKLARRSGMDPGLATQMTLLSDDGLDATYLAASLRQPPVTPAPPASDTHSPTSGRPAQASAAERLKELRVLLDQGLVTPTEYEERRKAILDTL